VAESCVFCEIVAGRTPAHRVLETDEVLAFLDYRPLFPGHLLLIPKEHVVTLPELPESSVQPFFTAAQLLSAAVEVAMKAQGTFVAMNNKVSQSIPHLHVHIVPRNKGDGLRGFFWPRKPYDSDEDMQKAAGAIRRALA
jgi:histidine triad (HIT) family protein